MDFGRLAVMLENLLFVGDKVPSLFGVTGDGGAGHRQFYSEIEFDCGINDGVKAEDLLRVIGVFGIAPHADSGIQIARQFGAAEEEGIGFGAVAKGDFGKDAPFDDQVQMGLLQFFLNPEDLVEDAWLFRIGLLETEGKDLHLGPGYFGIIGEAGGGAFDLDADFLEKVRLVQAVEDPFSDIFDDAHKLDALTFFFEPSAAPITGVGWKEGSIGGDDFVGDETEEFRYLHQGMEYPVIEVLAQPLFEIGESGFTGQAVVMEPGIKAVMFSPFPIMDD